MRNDNSLHPSVLPGKKPSPRVLPVLRCSSIFNSAVVTWLIPHVWFSYSQYIHSFSDSGNNRVLKGKVDYKAFIYKSPKKDQQPTSLFFFQTEPEWGFGKKPTKSNRVVNQNWHCFKMKHWAGLMELLLLCSYPVSLLHTCRIQVSSRKSQNPSYKQERGMGSQLIFTLHFHRKPHESDM